MAELIFEWSHGKETAVQMVETDYKGNDDGGMVETIPAREAEKIMLETFSEGCDMVVDESGRCYGFAIDGGHCEFWDCDDCRIDELEEI